jgi:hypothetical protein
MAYLIYITPSCGCESFESNSSQFFYLKSYSSIILFYFRLFQGLEGGGGWVNELWNLSLFKWYLFLIILQFYCSKL